MKILFILIITSLSCLADDSYDLRLLKLEKRIRELEKNQGQKEGKNLRSLDYKDKKINNSKQADSPYDDLSPKQKSDLLKQIESIKVNQAEQQRFLDEIMNED